MNNHSESLQNRDVKKLKSYKEIIKDDTFNTTDEYFVDNHISHLLLYEDLMA